MPITIFTPKTQVDDINKAYHNQPNFRFAYCDFNGFSVAYNWKVFSTEIVNSIWLKINKSEPPFRPHFIIDGYTRFPINPVALLIGDPITKFISACHEDGIDYEDAIKQVSNGKFPSFHFLHQSRFLEFGSNPKYIWRATDHIDHFWKTLNLGEPPKIYDKEIDFKHSDVLRKIYKEDFELYEKIKNPQTLIESKSGVDATILEQMRNVGFAVSKFTASGFKQTPPNILEDRSFICRDCDQWDAIALNNTGRCKKCGCSTWAKLRMATERCPIGKWEAVSTEDSKQ